MSESAVHRILKIDIALFLWKIQVNHPIAEEYGVKRFKFTNTIINMGERDEIVSKNIAQLCGALSLSSIC